MLQTRIAPNVSPGKTIFSKFTIHGNYTFSIQKVISPNLVNLRLNIGGRRTKYLFTGRLVVAEFVEKYGTNKQTLFYFLIYVIYFSKN